MGLSLVRFKKLFFQEKRKKNTRNTYLLSKNLPFKVTEAYKTARTNLMFSLAEETDKCKIILVTSAVPSEGKTTTAINLAISFAQTDARVLIIDCDLRKSRLHTAFDVDNFLGLTNVLAGFSSLNDAVRKHPSGLDYLTSGHRPPNPAELLSSKKMTDLLEQLSNSYDYIFLDTPPLTVVADAATIVKQSTGVVLVSKYNYTTDEDIEKVLSVLKFAEAKVLGVIMNNTESYKSTLYYDKNRSFSYKKKSYIDSYDKYYGDNTKDE